MNNNWKKVKPGSFKICAMLLMFLGPGLQANAALPIAEIIRQGVIRVIVAVDLKIQRMQNETIWLQQAQQQMENVLSKTRLEEIADWSERQKELYGDYYQGLWKVKSALTQYQRIREITSTQQKILISYQKTWNLLVREGQFSPSELNLIQGKFGKIISQSIQNLDELTSLLQSYTAQVSDADRLERIHLMDSGMQQNYQDLLSLTMQLEGLNVQRKAWKLDTKTLDHILR
jgi:hypothetical protein